MSDADPGAQPWESRPIEERTFDMKTKALAAAVTVVASGVAAFAAAPAQAATTTYFCFAGASSTSCTTDEIRFFQTHPTRTLLVTFWDLTNYRGSRAYVYGPRPCTAESDFGPADYRGSMPAGLSAKASSVTKYDAGHCNWVLVGPQGGDSTEVEGSRADLGALGSGWSNRAVGFKLD